MKQVREFEECKVCGGSYVKGAGMARHQQRQHGVAPVTTAATRIKAGPSKLSLAERLARINAWAEEEENARV